MGLLSRLLRFAKVRPAGGDEGRVALQKCLDDPAYAGITLTLNRPEDVKVIWERI